MYAIDHFKACSSTSNYAASSRHRRALIGVLPAWLKIGEFDMSCPPVRMPSTRPAPAVWALSGLGCGRNVMTGDDVLIPRHPRPRSELLRVERGSEV